MTTRADDVADLTIGAASIVATERCKDVHPIHIKAIERATGVPWPCESCQSWGWRVAGLVAEEVTP